MEEVRVSEAPVWAACLIEPTLILFLSSLRRLNILTTDLILLVGTILGS